MTIRDERIDALLAGPDPSTVLRSDGRLGELKKQLLHRLMAAACDPLMTEARASGQTRNHRNGAGPQRVLTDDGHGEVTVPRDRDARFDPVLVGQSQRRRPGFDA